jgi:hypothetical protein
VEESALNKFCDDCEEDESIFGTSLFGERSFCSFSIGGSRTGESTTLGTTLGIVLVVFSTFTTCLSVETKFFFLFVLFEAQQGNSNLQHKHFRTIQKTNNYQENKKIKFEYSK